ncbi:TIGR02234 family membrane protein [Streptomyces sp. HSG2]|uniref:TIGR02234 family membrane protein n=1 Tax=Streptomyces sp. HSG2 TaxID=2797167 RepID=UPI001905A690|nr:TIGR02234 family membrane protein [Streptomyces sp. HSG2]
MTAEPPAPADPEPPAPADPGHPAPAARRSLALALLGGALGVALVLLSSRQEWATGTVSVAGGDFPATASGGEVTGVPAALAVVGLAALVALFAVRRAGRRAVAVVLALSGAGALVSALPRVWVGGALDERAAAVAGDTTASVHSVATTAWPYTSVAGGALILLAGLLALRHGRWWPAMSGRHERSGPDGRPRAVRTAGVPERPEDLWKALDRGEDPTGGEPEASGERVGPSD